MTWYVSVIPSPTNLTGSPSSSAEVDHQESFVVFVLLFLVVSCSVLICFQGTEVLLFPEQEILSLLVACLMGMGAFLGKLKASRNQDISRFSSRDLRI